MKAKFSNPFQNGDSADPYADMDEAELRTEIDAGKEEFIELDIDDSRTEMVQLAKDLAEMNGKLASRKGDDPTAKQYHEAAEKWGEVAKLVIDGTDPTDQLQSSTGGPNAGSEAGGDIADDIKQFHEGVPETSFDDVGGYRDVKSYLREQGIKLIEHREFLQTELNQSVLNGLILTGPPGTGKTLMAKAFAGELDAELDADISVFKVKPGELKRGVRGESGSLLRGLFAAAKQAQPAVVIFEEIDSLIQDRSDNSVQMMRSDRDLVNAFLEEVNEIDTEDVIVMGTTNRADALDEASIRDKRLDTMEMGLPDAVTRVRIFRIHLNKIDEKYVNWKGIDISQLASKTSGMSGATIATIVDNAILSMGLEYKEGERNQPVLTRDDLLRAIENKQDD